MVIMTMKIDHNDDSHDDDINNNETENSVMTIITAVMMMMMMMAIMKVTTQIIQAVALTVDVVGMFSQNVLVEFLSTVVFMCHFTQSCQVVTDRHRDSVVVRLVSVRLVTCSLQ